MIFNIYLEIIYIICLFENYLEERIILYIHEIDGLFFIKLISGLFFSPFDCVVDQDLVRRWIVHAGDGDHSKQKFKRSLWFIRQSLAESWWHLLF